MGYIRSGRRSGTTITGVIQPAATSSTRYLTSPTISEIMTGNPSGRRFIDAGIAGSLQSAPIRDVTAGFEDGADLRSKFAVSGLYA
jgi:hypothetical protein